MKHAVRRYGVAVLLVLGVAASALAAIAPSAVWQPSEARDQGRFPGLQAPAWRALRWPDAVDWQPVLGAARWQGCPLDVALFQSTQPPLRLAQQWSALLPTSAGLLSEPEALNLHWYRDGWHWLVQLIPTAAGGSAGSVSALALRGCAESARSALRRGAPGELRLAWREPHASNWVQQTVRRIGRDALTDTVAPGAGEQATMGQTTQRWQHDVVVAGEMWRIEHAEAP